MLNQMKIFDKAFNFYSKPELPWKFFKIRFEAFFLDQVFLDFLETLALFPLSVKKRLVNNGLSF